ncbi:MAG TPA: CDP-diacylglycerol--serine O-phosphatidyltransferase, partial [Leptospiraceae bacterium]|nr:CDP-diacylglycerol--serine O-phosphatidyltransferase [Leptospiraceae bacterium]
KPQVAIRGKFTKGRILIILGGFAVLFFFLGLAKVPFVMYGLLIFYVSSGFISLIIQLIQDYYPDNES